MYVVLGILAFLALGGITYLFLSKKSTKIEKLAAMGALILSGLVLGICGAVLIFAGDAEEVDPFVFPLDPQPVEQPKSMSNATELLILVLVLLIFGGFIAFIWFREKKRLAAEAEASKDKNRNISFSRR
jgi:flagellar basal body-associated protein FliL